MTNATTTTAPRYPVSTTADAGLLPALVEWTTGPLIMKVIDALTQAHGLGDAYRDPAVTMLHLRLTNAPYLPLVIEKMRHLDDSGRFIVSLAHYGEQNGDLMRDPEMLFDWLTGEPLYTRMDYLGVERWVYEPGTARRRWTPRLSKDLKSFAATWARNLKEQGWLDADVVARSSTHPDLVTNAGAPAGSTPEEATE